MKNRPQAPGGLLLLPITGQQSAKFRQTDPAHPDGHGRPIRRGFGVLVWLFLIPHIDW